MGLEKMMKTKVVMLAMSGAVSLFFLSGCAGLEARKIGSGTVYTISADTKQCRRYATLRKTLKITMPSTARELDSTKILYSKNRYALEGYVLSRWSDTPASMIRKVMTEALDASGLYRNVVGSHIKGKKDYLLQSELWEFRQVFEGGVSYGVLKIKMFLLSKKSGRLVSSRRFIYKVKAPSNDTYGAVVSLNRAASLMLRDMCRWLGKVR